MNILIYILSGVIIGIIIGLVIKNKKTIISQSCCAPQAEENQGIMTEQMAEKEKNLAKIREYVIGVDLTENPPAIKHIESAVEG